LIWFCIIALVIAGLSPLFYPGSGVIAGSLIFLFCFATAGFIAWLWILTYYDLKESELFIKYGPFTKSVPYSGITSAKPIRSWAASAATSINRVEIRYGNYDFVYISPLDQEAFLLELKHRCPNA